jgi:hypothetical protein
MEEFYKMKIRDGQRGKYDKKISMHINGLRYEIQDEFNMMICEDSGEFLSDCKARRRCLPKNKSNEKEVEV